MQCARTASLVNDLRILMWGYLISLLFTGLFNFPMVGQKIQLPELLIILMVPRLVLRHHRAMLNHIQTLGKTLYLLVLPSMIHLVSFCFQPSQAAFLECTGALYLAILALIISWWIMSDRSSIPKLADICSVAILLSYAISLISILSIWLPIVRGIDLTVPKPVPGLGEMHRVEGFSITPNMQASFLVIFLSLFLSTATNILSRSKRLVFSLGLFALIVTGSKVMVTALMVILSASPTWLSNRLGGLPAHYRILGIAGIVLYLGFLHLPCMTDSQYKQLNAVSYLQGTQLYHPLSGVTCRASTYTLLKEQAIGFFRQHPFIGLGSGQFATGIRQQQATGAYPAAAPVYAPHSTYFGILAENGLVGFSLLAIWIILFMRKVIQLPDNQKNKPIIGAVGMLLLFFLLEGMNMDVLNHRGLWVVIGIALGSHFNGNKQVLSFDADKPIFGSTN